MPTPTASHVWPAGLADSGRRTQAARFTRRLTLAAAPGRAELRLFASTRYRLLVNGAFVASGPVRFVPGHERHDAHDLAPHLRAGDNAVVVEAWFVDARNFQSMPGDRGRFAAWGTVTAGGESHDLSTPGDWRAAACDAWRDDGPAYSFAIGPVEVLDVAALADAPDGDAPDVIGDVGVLADRPRGIPYPSFAVEPFACRSLRPIRPHGRRAGFVSVDPTLNLRETAPAAERPKFRYATFLHSPTPRRADVLAHWGPHYLNGAEVGGDDDPSRGNCKRLGLDLRAGWNLLCGAPSQLQAAYPMLLELPPDGGVTMHATPDAADPRPLRWAGQGAGLAPWPAPPASAGDLDLSGDAWAIVAAGATPPCPARMMAWDVPDGDVPADPPALPARLDGGEWAGVFDHGGEYLGHVAVDLDAPAGTVVDVAYDERLRGDGCVALFATNPFTDTADRFVWPGGRATVETFLPRGGRYAQVTVRLREGETATLHAVGCRDVRCLPPVVGDVRTGDDVLDWAWRVGLATLAASTEDTFTDSPWRERGAYLGDSYVQTLVHLAASPDRAIPARALRLFADGIRDDGQLPCVCPAYLREPHGDFTLTYPLWLRDYWARTGDADTARHCLPAVDAALSSTTWVTTADSPLWDATVANRMFIDWGVVKDFRVGPESGIVNAHRVRALRCAAELHRLGDAASPVAAGYERQADDVLAAFRLRLWDAGQRPVRRRSSRTAGPTRASACTSTCWRWRSGSSRTSSAARCSTTACAASTGNAAKAVRGRAARRLRRAVLPQVRPRRPGAARPLRRGRPAVRRAHAADARPRRVVLLGVPAPRRPRHRLAVPLVVGRAAGVPVAVRPGRARGDAGGGRPLRRRPAHHARPGRGASRRRRAARSACGGAARAGRSTSAPTARPACGSTWPPGQPSDRLRPAASAGCRAARRSARSARPVERSRSRYFGSSPRVWYAPPSAITAHIGSAPCVARRIASPSHWSRWARPALTTSGFCAARSCCSCGSASRSNSMRSGKSW